jgi:hypothetical protein
VNLVGLLCFLLAYLIDFTVWIPSLSPEQSSASHRQTLFQDVFTDPLTLALTLAATYARAANASAWNGKSHSNDPRLTRLYLVHKGTALHLVQESFRDMSLNSFPEKLFMAMGALAGCEFQANNPHEGRLHIAAWIRLIGRNFQRLSILNLELLCLNEMRFSCLLGEPPLYEAIVPKMLPELPPFARVFPSHFYLLLDSHNATRLTDAILNLFEATKLINDSPNASIPKDLQDTLLLRVLLAGFCLCQSVGEANRTTVNPSFYESVRLAALLVINTTHFKGSPKFHLIDKLLTDLQSQLQADDLDLGLCWQKFPQAMLWIFFTGMYSSLDDKNNWFVENIRDGMVLLNLKTWTSGREMLKLFPYINKEFDVPFEKIWDYAQSSLEG